MSAVLALVGATATGKSAIALAAAVESGAEIVNADAFQLYRGLDIGTAKPTAAARAEVRHHLLDLLDPSESFSAGEFARRARVVLAEIAARGRPAIVVGGSGFYLRALWRGLAPVPPVPRQLRSALVERLRVEGIEPLRRELSLLDPPSALRIAANDAQRIVRALEVAQATGLPLSSWIAGSTTREAEVVTTRFGLTLPRAVLYDRIAERFHGMVESGWPDEVRRLLAAGVGRQVPAFRAIGYSDWVRHLEGELGREELEMRVVRASRRYAKRQETWFRREEEIVWLDAREPDAAIAAIVKQLGE